MRTAPLTCPNCGAFALAGWVDACGNCGTRWPESDGLHRFAEHPKGTSFKAASLGLLTFVGVLAAFGLIGYAALWYLGDAPSIASDGTTKAGPAHSTTSTTSVSQNSDPALPLPQVGDLGAAWTTDSGVNVASAAGLKEPNACAPDDALMLPVGRATENYFFTPATGLATEVQVLSAKNASADLTTHQMQFNASAANRTCVAQKFAKVTTPGAVFTATKPTVVTTALPVNNVHLAFKATTKTTAGVTGRGTLDIYYLGSGARAVTVIVLAPLTNTVDQIAFVTPIAQKLADDTK